MRLIKKYQLGDKLIAGSEVKELPKLIKRTNPKNTDFIKRLLDPNRKSISD